MVTITHASEDEPDAKTPATSGPPTAPTTAVETPLDVLAQHPASAGMSPADGVAPRRYSAETCHPACVVQPARDARAASAAKARGNELFAARRLEEALDAYSEALELAPRTPDHEYSRAVFYANRAACFAELARYGDVVSDCTRALELDPRYLKAYVRRSRAHEALESLEDALADVNEALKIDPTQRALAAERSRLETTIRERNEKLKDEMLGKLKEVGNSILGAFGMSLDNFQMVQDPATGSYSINYKTS